jgi:NDP-sugar pyrophosphorylase family protein
MKTGLCGFSPRGGGADVLAREPRGEALRRDFTGIHVVAPELLDTLDGSEPYSIMNHYLRLVRDGARIARYEQPNARWIDIGSHEKLAEAQRLL